MTGCDWDIAGFANRPYPSNAAIVLVADHWPNVSQVSLDGQAQNPAMFAHPFARGANAVTVLPSHTGTNVVSSGSCSWTIEVGPQEDHDAPQWLTGLTRMPVEPRNTVPRWCARFSETSWLVVWALDGGSPIWLVPPWDAESTMFAVFHTEWEFYNPLIVPLPGTSFVVRPMDNAGNLGDAWLLNPTTGNASRVDDATPYVWNEFAAWLKQP